MAQHRKTAALCMTASLLVAGCADTGPGPAPIWPSTDGMQSPPPRSSTPAPVAQAPAPVAQAPAPVSPPAGSTGSAPAPRPVVADSGFERSSGGESVGSLQPTGTHVGLRIARLSQDLQRLQNALGVHRQSYAAIRPRMEANALTYQNTVAPIYARLQVGTTPGNPELVQNWNEAELRLTRVNEDVDQLNTLGNAVAADASLAAYLLDSVRATYGISGAYEQDHRQLKLLEDESARTVIEADRLLSEISGDVNRQGNYVAAEQSNLTALALAIKTGSFFASPTRPATTAGEAPNPALSPAPSAGPAVGSGPSYGAPVMIVRFDRADVKYEAPLREVIATAKARNPNARFDVVGFAARGKTTASVRAQAEQVFKAMVRNGVAAGSVDLSAVSGTLPNNEVHIFAR